MQNPDLTTSSEDVFRGTGLHITFLSVWTVRMQSTSLGHTKNQYLWVNSCVLTDIEMITLIINRLQSHSTHSAFFPNHLSAHHNHRSLFPTLVVNLGRPSSSLHTPLLSHLSHHRFYNGQQLVNLVSRLRLRFSPAHFSYRRPCRLHETLFLPLRHLSGEFQTRNTRSRKHGSCIYTSNVANYTSRFSRTLTISRG